MANDNDNEDQILVLDEDGNIIDIIDKEMMQLELFKTKNLKPNKTGGQIKNKRKRKKTKKKPRGWGKARYGK
tara:strand:- start:1725 stop:1940 length:216 start_codon:yes stop_codon:yes gene_type:complete